MKKSIYDTGYNTTIRLSLRRTLVRSGILWSKPTPGRLQYNHSSNSPFRGGEVLQSTSIFGVSIPSLEGRQKLLTMKNLKGAGLSLLLFLLPIFSLLAQQATWIWYPGNFEIVLANKVQNCRTERNTFFPVFWKVDSVFNFKLNDNQISI